MSDYPMTDFVREIDEHFDQVAARVSEIDRKLQELLSLQFPQDKAKIAKLNFQQKRVWYATRDPQTLVFLSNTKEFVRFWNLHYLWRLRIIRFYYKLKTGEFWRKKYQHISEIREKAKKERPDEQIIGD